MRFFVGPSKRPDPINIPVVFAEFVKSIGGELSDELYAEVKNREQNADYVFRESNVVAELKSLEIDPLDTKRADIIARLLTKSGMTDDEINDWISGKSPVSEKGFRALETYFKKLIERIARKANKQIASTKNVESLPNARGVLLIANDKNFLFDPLHKHDLISDVMARHLANSNIHAVVFFSPNVPMIIPNSLRELMPWIPNYAAGAYDLAPFIDDLGARWGDYITQGEDALRIKIAKIDEGRDFLRNGRNLKVPDQTPAFKRKGDSS